MKLIQTHNGTYEKPGFWRNQTANTAATATSIAVAAVPQLLIAKAVEKGFDKYGKAEDSIDLSSKLNDALNLSKMNEKGVKIVDYKNINPKNLRTPSQIIQENLNKYLTRLRVQDNIDLIDLDAHKTPLMQFIDSRRLKLPEAMKGIIPPSENIAELNKALDKTCTKPSWFKKFITEYKMGRKFVAGIQNDIIQEQIKAGLNAGYLDTTKQILINSKKIGLAGFHEIGHAINANTSKLWKTIQHKRNPIIFLASLPSLTIFKRKKAEGEEPKNIIDKATTFVKNNVGKITTLAFTPIIVEELLATARGQALAKKVLSADLLKNVKKLNAIGALSYLGLAATCGLSATIANKVRDAIAKPKQV